MFDKLYAIQYPAGSFGHFTHLLLSTHGKNFNKVSANINFDNNMKSGSSHFTTSQIKKYYNIEEYKEYASTQLLQDYNKATEDGKYTTVLIDSGIDVDSVEFLHFFPGANYLRVCYDDMSWPLSAKSFYTRCMSEVVGVETSIENFVFPEPELWESNEPWEQREKYFLFLRDHQFRYMWRPNNLSASIDVDSFTSYNTLNRVLSSVIEINDFEKVYNNFRKNNSIHIDWYLRCRTVINAIQNNQHIDLSDITDLFSQATINYYIQILYNFEIPAYDYRDWFTTTTQIFSMFDTYGISY